MSNEILVNLVFASPSARRFAFDASARWANGTPRRSLERWPSGWIALLFARNAHEMQALFRNLLARPRFVATANIADAASALVCRERLYHGLSKAFRVADAQRRETEQKRPARQPDPPQTRPSSSGA